MQVLLHVSGLGCVLTKVVISHYKRASLSPPAYIYKRTGKVCFAEGLQWLILLIHCIAKSSTFCRNVEALLMHMSVLVETVYAFLNSDIKFESYTYIYTKELIKDIQKVMLR